MAKYVAIFVSLIFFVISVNSAVLEPSADIIRSEDAEEGKYYQRVKGKFIQISFFFLTLFFTIVFI
jgi:hypothetical protein